MAQKNFDVDALTQAQWMGAFACKFVPHDATRVEYNLNVARKYHCKLPRQSYLPLIAPAVIEHYFERPDDVADLRISFELMILNTADGTMQAVPAPEYYCLGVLVDALGGPPTKEDMGVLTFQFRITGGAPDHQSLLALTIRTVDRGLFLNLHQQQKASCVSLFGSNQAMMKLETTLWNQMDDGVRQNDCRGFYYPRNLVFITGAQDTMRSSISSALAVGDLALFVFHKDGQHALRTVSMRMAPTLGMVLRCCVACFQDLDPESIDNQPANSQTYAAVLLTGVEPALSTPTEFLRDHLACADFAVHLTIHQPPTSTRPRDLLPQVDWKALAKNANMTSPMLADGAPMGE